MSDTRRRRRSSFFPKPNEENPQNPFELFKNMEWLDQEKENIVSNSKLFGGQRKQALQEYTDKLISLKQEYQKLVSNKKVEQINLQEKLRKTKVEINWDTVCEELTDFERDFTLNRPNYKCLVKHVHLLTTNVALVKRANHELHVSLNLYNREANEVVYKLQELFVDKIVEDSGYGISYNNDSSATSSPTMESSEDECLISN